MADRKSVHILGEKLELTNLEKVLYPSSEFTKAGVLDYYSKVSAWILPHLRMRPLTLKRYPNGVEQEYFYQKQCPAARPGWLPIASISHTEGKSVNYCSINDLAGLVWVGNTASLELHVLLCRVPAPLRPTMVLFDLDPGDPAGLLDAARVSLLLRRILDGIGLESVVKVSGKKGIHCCVPLNTPYSFDQTKIFARTVAQKIEANYPEMITTQMRKLHRPGKVFIDWSQNDEHKTMVCPYSLRAQSKPSVSAPVSWNEVQRAVDLNREDLLQFPAEDMYQRLREKGDLFGPVLSMRQDLPGIKPEAVQPAGTWNSNRKNGSGRLKEYRRRRDFSLTPEPTDIVRQKNPARSFVIQKHDARALHYDFRLEYKGVLKSWAVPKGPSLEPAQKRLAVEVEDHPLEYAGFEGRIPEKQYGAGPVIVWDRGVYIVPGEPEEHDKYMKAGLEKGHLDITLKGVKIQGQFLLLRTQKQENGKNQWLLIKKKESLFHADIDPYATEPYSVLTGLWIEDL